MHFAYAITAVLVRYASAYTCTNLTVPVELSARNGVFDYDMNIFSPGGPDGSPDTAFLRVVPVRAVYIKAYGMGGTQRWSAA